MMKAWIEWKTVCSLDGCCEQTRACLHQFAGIRFGRSVRRCMKMTNRTDPESMVLPGRDAWHLLETHMTVKTSRAGKRYKDWLFARARSGSDPLQSIESGATLLMRDATRDYLRREFSPPGTVSIEDSWGCGPSLEELLPDHVDPASEAARREFERLARDHAVQLFGRASRRQKAALLARELGLSYSDAGVRQLAGCATTALYAAYPSFVESVGVFLRKAYPEEDPAALVQLALLTINQAKKTAVEWKKSRKTEENKSL